MEKELNSGVKVNADQYYKLLEWKDANMSEFKEWCSDHHVFPSINAMEIDIFYHSMANIPETLKLLEK